MLLQDTRERAHRAIKDRMDAAISSRAKADDKFQSFVATEIAEIKNAIRTETEVCFDCYGTLLSSNACGGFPCPGAREGG